MLAKIVASAIVLMPFSAMADVVCHVIGDQTLCSDGSSVTTIGDIDLYSGGGTGVRIDDTYIYSGPPRYEPDPPLIPLPEIPDPWDDD